MRAEAIWAQPLKRSCRRARQPAVVWKTAVYCCTQTHRGKTDAITKFCEDFLFFHSTIQHCTANCINLFLYFCECHTVQTFYTFSSVHFVCAFVADLNAHSIRIHNAVSLECSRKQRVAILGIMTMLSWMPMRNILSSRAH